MLERAGCVPLAVACSTEMPRDTHHAQLRDGSYLALLPLTPWCKEREGEQTCPCSAGDRREKRTRNLLEQKDKIKPGQFLLLHRSRHPQSTQRWPQPPSMPRSAPLDVLHKTWVLASPLRCLVFSWILRVSSQALGLGFVVLVSVLWVLFLRWWRLVKGTESVRRTSGKAMDTWSGIC